jgi:hypothetical protein
MKKISGIVLCVTSKGTSSTIRLYGSGSLSLSDEVIVKLEGDLLIITRPSISFNGKTRKLTKNKEYDYVQISYNSAIENGKYSLDDSSDEDNLVFNVKMPICVETNVELNGHDEEEFTVTCHDGYAFAFSPKTNVYLEYPKLKDLNQHQIESALMYRGIDLKSKPTYGDIMISYGVEIK